MQTKEYIEELDDGSELYDKALKKLQNLRNELENYNRFFPRSKFCIDCELNQIGKHSEAISPKDLKLYRARLIDDDLKKRMKDTTSDNTFYGLSESEYLAPPNDKATEGRCNPRGISYLYTSTDLNTAIKEIKPSISDSVAVAELGCKKSMRLFGANTYNKYISAFAMQDAISSVFSRPFTLDKSYILTQYLSEKIKSMGFDGLYIKSSTSESSNVIIFIGQPCFVKNVKLYKIEELQYRVFNITYNCI